MKLVFHHFKKDVRQFRVFLTIWFGLLLLDLAVNLGWVGNVEWSPSRGFDTASNAWTGMLPIVLWAFVAILPSLVMLADSLARHDGFLSTRPFPKRDLLLAKAFFVLAMIVAPWTVAELVNLIFQASPTWVIYRGTLERLLFTIPAVFCSASFASLWPGTARWVRALGILAAAYVLTGITFGFLVQVLRLADLPTFNFSQTLVSIYIFVFATLSLAWWHSRGHRGWKFRWGGLFLCGALAWIGGLNWKADFFKLHPENQPGAEAVMAQAGVEIPRRGFVLAQERDNDESLLPKVTIQLSPKTRALPDGQVVSWAAINYRLLRPDGSVAHSGKSRAAAQPFVWNLQPNLDEVKAWASEFPRDVLFRQSTFSQIGLNIAGFFSLPRFDLPSTEAGRSQPLQVETEFEAQLFRWRKIADLPLTAGAESRDDFGSWKIAAVPSDAVLTANGAPRQAELFVERRQIELFTATNSRCSSINSGPLTRMAFAVYDPATQVAWLPEANWFWSQTRGGHTAVTRHFLSLHFDGRNPFTEAELSRLRLVVLEKVWLGTVAEQWQSGPFSLEEKLASNGFRFTNSRGSLTRLQASRRIAALKAPNPDASRREVGSYLLNFFQVLDAYGYSLESRDPEIAKLAQYVPAHLNLLLEGLPAMNWSSRSAALMAIRTGAIEEQKSSVIAAIQREPDLCEVLLARDWTADARAQIYQLTNSIRSLPFSALQAIASFRDPKTYPCLLEAFEAAPDERIDNLLENLGLELEAGAIIKRVWARQGLVLGANQAFDRSFILAMRHGEKSALQRTYAVINDTGTGTEQVTMNFELTLALAETIWMPDLSMAEQLEPETVMAWMRQHRIENFTFSTALRRFVLRSDGISSASSGNRPPSP